MELTISELADSLRRFSEYLQRVGSELFTEAFRIHSVSSLSVQQLRYLEVIEGQPGVTPAELAAAFEVRKPTVSNMVSQLENMGLVDGQTDQHDRRVKRLHPSGVASEIFERRRGMYAKLARHIEERLSNPERRELIRLMLKVASGLEAGDG
jgi:DNA-binding MarR family transcriptional regulator